EGCTGLTAGLFERLLELVGGSRDTHPATAATHGRLDDNGIADLDGQFFRLCIGLDGSFTAGEDRNVCLLRDMTGDNLVSQLLQNIGTRSNEQKPGSANSPGEMGILGKETISWVDGVYFILASKGDDALDVEIGADGLGGPADAIGLVGLEAMQGEAV